MKGKAKAVLDRRSHTKEFFDNLDLPGAEAEEGVSADSRALAEQEGWIKVAECDWCHATKDTIPYDDSGRRICKACTMTPGIVDDELEAGKAAATPSAASTSRKHEEAACQESRSTQRWRGGRSTALAPVPRQRRHHADGAVLGR